MRDSDENSRRMFREKFQPKSQDSRGWDGGKTGMKDLTANEREGTRIRQNGRSY
jgi:hypothetical protein